MKPPEAVRWCATCPDCCAGYGEHCFTRTGRNHPGRVRAAIEQALYDLVYPQNEGLRIREGMRRRRARERGEAGLAADAGTKRMEPSRVLAGR